MLFAVVSDPIDSSAVAAGVADDSSGAVVTFEGRVRRQSRGREVLRLEYEAYVPMALAVFRRIATDAAARWAGARLAIHHRVGICAIGEISVVVVAASPHRAEAFEACRFAIDQLKAEAPIWKREVYADGVEWIGQGS